MGRQISTNTIPEREVWSKFNIAINHKLSKVRLQFRAKSGYVIRAGLSWSPKTTTETEPWPVFIWCS